MSSDYPKPGSFEEEIGEAMGRSADTIGELRKQLADEVKEKE